VLTLVFSRKDASPVIEKDPEEWKEQKSHIKESYLAMQQQHDQIQQELEERKPGHDTILHGKEDSGVSSTRDISIFGRIP
jgi:hypothetical protein